MKNDQIVPAAIACAACLPIMVGVGWLAGEFTSVAMTGIAASHGQSVQFASPFYRMIWALLGIWALTSIIVMGMAWAGLGGGPRIYAPPVYPPRDEP